MEFEELYFDFLVDIVCNRAEAKEYSDVLEYLYNKPFYYTIMMDQNRESDGIALRERFANNYMNGLYFVQIMNLIDNRDCSMLEMMVALAYRMEKDILNDDSFGDQTGKWFWVMMENLDIDKRNREFVYDDVNDKVDICLERGYDYEGHGSFFTVHNPRQDMRQTEIWYQANWWITYEYYDWED